MLSVYSAKAYDFENNGFYYNILSLSDLTVELTCQGTENEYSNSTASYNGDITIPKTTEYANKTFKVIQINPFAFINCAIGTLTIPETIEKIGDGTQWYENRGMHGIFSNLVIEDSDKPIKCSNALVHTGSHSDEQVVNIQNSVYLGRDIECSNFRGIVYNHWGFFTNGGTYKKITFGPKVTSIPEHCCVYCVNLTEVNIPSNIKCIKDNAFYGCTSLTEVHGDCVVELDNGAFTDCRNLTSFDFPSLKILGKDCFASCTSLKDIVLPSGVVAIYGDENGGAFYGCTSLESIVIPSTIVKMGDSYYYGYYYGGNVSKIFVGCSSLKTISIANPTPIEFSESNFDMLSFLSTTLKVPIGAKKAYSEAPGWKNFSNIVEDETLVGDIYTVYYDNDYSYGGSLNLVFEDALEPYGKYRFAKDGTTITINIKPENGYKIKSLNIDGIDVTSEIESSTYTFTVTNNVSISASFVLDRDPIYLSIRQGDNGCMKMKINKGNSYRFIISPSEGWKIHSVSYNGQDMTEELEDGNTFYTAEIYENSELVVAFEAVVTEVPQMVASKAKVLTASDNIIIKDATPSENILICDEAGLVIANCKGNNSEQKFSVSKTGVYIVKVGSKVIKVAM